MRKTSDYLRLKIDGYKYLFYIVASEYWYKTRNQYIQALEETFSHHIGTECIVISSYPEESEKNFDAILSIKNWPHDIEKVLTRDSGLHLLIISKNLQEFNPDMDKFVLVDFSGDAILPGRFFKALEDIQAAINKKKDLFDWFDERAEKENSLTKRIYDASDIQINVYFYSFSIKKFLKWEGSSIHS